MNKLKAFSTLLLSALGVFGANEFYKPRNIKDLLKGRGVKLSSDDKVGDSMFYENRDDLKALNILDAKALGTGCSEKFKVTNLSDEIFNEVKKYCSDSATSIMGRIIREGENNRLIKEGDSEAFKISYLLASNKEEIKKLINISEVGPEDLELVSKKLEEYCKGQEREKILTAEDKDVFGNFKKLCYNLRIKKFSDLLERKGRRAMKTDDEFRTKFNDEKLKYVAELRGEIGDLLKDKDGETNGGKNRIKGYLRTSKSPIDQKNYGKLGEMEEKKERIEGEIDKFLLDEYGGIVFRSGCQSKLSKTLINEGLDSFNKFNFRCSVENK